MFEIEGMKILEILARVSLIFIGCMLLLRLAGRREMSDLAPMDLLAMLLLSETVSPALTGGDESIPGNLAAATTLIAWCVVSALLVSRSKKMEILLEGQAVVVIESGKVSPEVLKRFRISSDDVENALHKHGLLHVREVKRAYVEADGEITIIKQKDWEESQERFFSKA